MKSIARIIVAAVLSISLMSCVGLQSFTNPVGRTQLVEIESAYGIALSVAVAYRNACAAKKIAATCRPIVAQLQSADRKAQGAIAALRAFVRANPTVSAASLAAAAWAAVDNFKAVEATYGVQ